MARARQPEAADCFVWRKLSPAKWEDVWQERLGWLGQRLVIFVLKGWKTLRLEAHHVSRAEADELVREFGGTVRVSKELTPQDLEPKPRAPLKVRGKLVIVGQIEERAAWEKKGVPCIFIPATMAFGTGDHATTATCLRLLADEAERLPAGAWEALDLGTGSGILAFAARLLGARKVEAGDFDATAVRVAKENAAHNGLKNVTFKKFDVLKWQPARKWPVVLANVYGPILIEAAPQIAAAVAPGGCLILSGILREQAPEVLPAFTRQKLREEKVVKRGKWVTARLRR
jgi:ribosomal protein L11 methyltransferase